LGIGLHACIILTGFMGTGKSTVGEEVARQLGWPFVDMDALIEAREGRSIRRIFDEAGEAHFRQLEAALCREVAGWRERVVATGGGTLVNPENLSLLASRHLVICLDCHPDVLWARLAAAEDRPMLDAGDRRARLLALLSARQPAYARIPHHVDTTHRSPAEVAEAVLSLWQTIDD